MNAAKIYATSVGKRIEDPEKQKQAIEQAQNDANLKASISQWEHNPITKLFFKGIEEDILNSMDRARELAMSYHQHKNHDEIIKNLIVATTLQEIVKGNVTNHENH